MGTHSRIFNFSSPATLAPILKLLLLIQELPGALPPGARRWFDMDDATLQPGR